MILFRTGQRTLFAPEFRLPQHLLLSVGACVLLGNVDFHVSCTLFLILDCRECEYSVRSLCKHPSAMLRVVRYAD